MMSELKLIQEWKLLFMKKRIKKMTENKMLLLTNLIMSSHLNQSFCMYEQKKQRYRSTFWLTRSLWLLIWEWWWTIEEKCSVICKETFKEWRWTENLDWIQWSLINHEFNILIEATFQLFFRLWYLHHQWCKRYNAFLSTICRWQSK